MTVTDGGASGSSQRSHATDLRGFRVHVRSSNASRAGVGLMVLGWAALVVVLTVAELGRMPLQRWGLFLGAVGVLGGGVCIGMGRSLLGKRAAMQHDTLCPKCYYALNDLGEHGTCPECGTAFDIKQVKAAWARYR